MENPDAVLIAGPTAAGKTRFALDIATQCDGEIINTDSMQIYNGLPILTAKPTAQELANIPHHLLGHHPPEKPYSVSIWLEEVRAIWNELKSQEQIPIFVGGTGLYFKALLEGIAFVPEIPNDIRQNIRNDLIRKGAPALHNRLSQLDPQGAESLKPQDGNRIARALEVITATGQPLSFFQSQPAEKPILADMKIQKYLIMPSRPVLHERINQRADKMVDAGLVEEVRLFLKQNLPTDTPLSKAIGVAQIQGYLRKEIDLKEAIADLKTQTRRYAKRQCTWFNNQFDSDWQKVG